MPGFLWIRHWLWFVIDFKLETNLFAENVKYFGPNHHSAAVDKYVWLSIIVSYKYVGTVIYIEIIHRLEATDFIAIIWHYKF